MGITRRYRILVAILAALFASEAVGLAIALGGDAELTLGAEERQQIARGLRELTRRLERWRTAEVKGSEGRRDHLADAEMFAKGIAVARATGARRRSCRWMERFHRAEVSPAASLLANLHNSETEGKG